MDKKQQELFNSSLKLLVKTSFVVFIGLILSKILTYVYRVIIARYFGPEVYGLFTLALAIFTFFVTFSSLGFSEGMVRFTPKLRAENKIKEISYLLKKTIIFYIFSGIIFSIILIFLSEFIAINIFHNSSLVYLLRVLSIGIVLYLFFNLFLSLLRGFEEIGWYSFLLNILQNILKVIILIIFIVLGVSSGERLVAWAFILSLLVMSLISYFVCKYKISPFNLRDNSSYRLLFNEFFSYSWPVMFYSIAYTLLYWIDSFSLGFYKSSLEVGLYNAAVPIAMFLIFVPELFIQLFFPMINREYSKKNYLLIEQLSKQVNKWILIAGLPIFILLFSFPGAALNILFGSDYLASQNSLKVLLVGSFISSLFVISNNLISMKGKSKILLMDLLFAIILDLILNSLLIPIPKIFLIDNSNGLFGASLATLISIIFLNFLFMFQSIKYFSFIPLRRKMIRVILISLIPIFILFYLRSIIKITIFSIIFLTFLFIIIYLLLILLSNSLDRNDKLIIASFLKKINFIKNNGLSIKNNKQ